MLRGQTASSIIVDGYPFYTDTDGEEEIFKNDLTPQDQLLYYGV